MKKLGDVRSVSGTPVANDFANQGGTPLVIDIASGTGYYMDGAGTVQALAGGGGGGGAPTGASYLTLSLDAGLTAERVLTAGAGISFVDTGANGTLTIASTVTPAAWTEVEVDFGSTPTYDAQFTVVDAALTAAKKVAVLACGKAATGRTAGDDQWDAITYSALPAAGSMTVYAYANPGPVMGKRKIQYQVA